MTYQVGQRVKRPVHNWHFAGNNPVEPGELGIVKIVLSGNRDFKYHVWWDRGHANTYRDEDLEPLDSRPLEEQIEDLLG
jgi:hypothetical protein